MSERGQAGTEGAGAAGDGDIPRIIESSTELLAENPGASMKDIAAASGLRPAALAEHFPTREDLLRAVYRYAAREASSEARETEPGVRRRADAARNTRSIIEAATGVLADNPSASMAEVAEASGLVRATVYRHFPTRDDLLRAIHSHALEDAGRAITEAEPERGPAPDAVRRLVDALISVADRFRIVSEERREFPELTEQAESVGAPLVALMKRGQKGGELRGDLPAEWLAAALASLVQAGHRGVSRGDVRRTRVGEAVTATFLSGATTAGAATARGRSRRWAA